MISKDEAEARVAQGAAYLDRQRPGWHDQIDDGTLTLSDSCLCVVGQLGGGAWNLRRLGLSQEEAIACGMNLNEPGWADFRMAGGTVEQWYQPLQDAWVTAIASRRWPVSVKEPPTAVDAVRLSTEEPVVLRRA